MSDNKNFGTLTSPLLKSPLKRDPHRRSTVDPSFGSQMMLISKAVEKNRAGSFKRSESMSRKSKSRIVIQDKLMLQLEKS